MIINLTPHDVCLIDVAEDGERIERERFPASGSVARLSETVVRHEIGAHRPIPVVDYGRLVGLPDPDGETYYLVSLVCALAAKDRDDLLIAYDQVRDDAGQIVGARWLGRVAR